MSRASEWQEVATADTYLDQRHRNWVLAEELGDVVFVSARSVVLVHLERAEHVAAALAPRSWARRLRSPCRRQRLCAYLRRLLLLPALRFSRQ